MVDMTILGITLQDNIPVLLLHPQGTDTILPLRIGPAEAFAISTVIHPFKSVAPSCTSKIQPTIKTPQNYAPKKTAHGQTDRGQAPKDSHPCPPLRLSYSPRPMTHDLTLTLIESLGGTLLSIEITSASDGIYYADAIMQTPQGPVRIDCRPSDGIALAVRTNACIRCSHDVLAFAKPSQSILQSLPEHIRLLAQASLDKSNQTAAEPTPSETSQKSLLQMAAHAAKAIQLTQKEISKRRVKQVPQKRPVASAIAPQPSNLDSDIAHQLLEKLIINTKKQPAKPLGYLPAAASFPEGVDYGNTPDDSRWAALLHLLSPETKELM